MTRVLGVPAWAAAVAPVLLLAACSKPPEAAEPQRLASVQEIMSGIVDPAADSLWESVSTEVTAQGSVERAPRTDADWSQVRGWAVTLVEAPNLLVMPGRPVAHPGAVLDDASTPGIEPPARIQKAIAEDPRAFALRAKALQDAGRRALAAVDARNVGALVEAGAQLDQACEACHRQYWYPHSPGPPAPERQP